MNDKSLLSRYHQGDVYIIKDKKPTPGTTGEHPYLVISNDGAEVIYTVPISSAYTDYLPISEPVQNVSHHMFTDGRSCSICISSISRVS